MKTYLVHIKGCYIYYTHIEVKAPTIDDALALAKVEMERFSEDNDESLRIVSIEEKLYTIPE